MVIRELLKLPKDEKSLIKVIEFLSTTQTQADYVLAFGFYLNIQLTLKQYQTVYQEAKRFLSTNSITDDVSLETIYTPYIEVCFELNLLEDAKQLILKRHQYLPVLLQYITTLDIVRYKKVVEEDYLDELLKLKKEALPHQEMIDVEKDLYQYYLVHHQYQQALIQLDVLYAYDLSYLYPYDRMMLYQALGNYELLKESALAELAHKGNDIQIVYYLLVAYYQLNLTRKAIILDADYESKFNSAPLELQKSIYEILIDLYKKEDNPLSIQTYQKRLKDVNRKIQKQANKEVVVVEDIKEVMIEDNVMISDKIPLHKPVSKQFLQVFNTMQSWIVYAYQIDYKKPFREFLRLFFIEVNQTLSASDIMVYMAKKEINFFHYKKERLYDKQLLDATLENTILNHVYLTKDEVFNSFSQVSEYEDVLTRKPYVEQGYVIALPIHDQGVLQVYFDQDIDIDVYYDQIKSLAAVIYSKIIAYQQNEWQQKQIKYDDHLKKHPFICLREHSLRSTIYNPAAASLFQIDAHQYLDVFIHQIRYDMQHQYEQTIAYLLANPYQTKTIDYQYQQLDIIEHLYSIKYGDEVVVVSVFLDQTELSDENRKLFLRATNDEMTGLLNQYALDQKMNDFLNEKTTFVLIELDMSLKYIYGSAKMNEYFREFSQLTKQYFESGVTYRKSEFELLVCLPFNDIRSVTHHLVSYNQFIKDTKITSIGYQPFNYHMGVLRYPVVTTERNYQKIYTFLDIALDMAKRQKDTNYYYFLYKDFETESFEQTVINHLNDAIEHKDLAILFHQIIDIKNNYVWQYESELVLSKLSIDGKYLYNLAKKRQRIVDLDFFHLESVFIFLNQLEKETGRQIKVTIPIAKETFISPKFNQHLFRLLKTYQINKEFIRIKTDVQFKTQAYILQFEELINSGISLDATQVDMAMIYPFHCVHMPMKKGIAKWLTYLKRTNELLLENQMALVVRDVKSKEEKEQLDKIGIRYIEGSIYKQLTPSNLLNKIKDSL